jgi:hypothetical protein
VRTKVLDADDYAIDGHRNKADAGGRLALTRQEKRSSGKGLPVLRNWSASFNAHGDSSP